MIFAWGALLGRGGEEISGLVLYGVYRVLDLMSAASNSSW